MSKQVEMRTALGLGGPVIQITLPSGRRSYKLPVVKDLPEKVKSVTTITGDTLKSYGIEKWKDGILKRELEGRKGKYLSAKGISDILSAPNRESGEGQRVGSEMHNIVESLLRGNTHGPEIYIPDQLEPAVRGFLRWRRRFSHWQFIQSEVAVYKRGSENYGGTMDALFYDEQQETYHVVDWKTSRKDIYGESFMQVAAYCRALEYMFHTDYRYRAHHLERCSTGVLYKVRGMVARFDNDYPKDADLKEIRTEPKVFTDKVQIAHVDSDEWYPVFKHCHDLSVYHGRKTEWLT